MTARPSLRARFREPAPLFFALLAAVPSIAHVLGNSGVDFVMLDAEHGEFNPSSMSACIDALRQTPAAVVVRTATANPGETGTLVVDMGVDGVQIPHVGGVDDIQPVIRAARAGGTDDVAVIAMIESGRGVSNAAEIAALTELDGLCLGPADLAEDLGLPGQLDHPSVRAAIDEVVWTAVAAGKRICAPHYTDAAAARPLAFVWCGHYPYSIAAEIKQRIEAGVPDSAFWAASAS